MKKNDYINHLDGIRCSAEFRVEMEKKLSSEPDGEYADSVSDIEYAPKVNYHRWTALAASALIVVGIGGFAFLNRGSIETPVGSNISSESTTVPSSKYNIGVSISYKNRMTSIGTLPPEIAERYIDEMKSWSDFKLDSVPQLANEPTGAITLSFTGEDSFTWKIDSNGYAVTKRNGKETEEAYYSDICYRALSGWIARDMLYFDWTCIAEGDKGVMLDTAFKNHANEIEITDNVGDMRGGVQFWKCGISWGAINPAGDIFISCDEGSACFRSSTELYKEIYNAVQDDLINRIMETENMFYASTGGTSPYYNVHFSKVDFSDLCDAIKSVEWTVAAGELPKGEFFNIGNYIYVTKDCIYDDKNHVVFMAEDSQTYSEIFSTVERAIPGDLSYIAYLIASADNRFDTISGEISYLNSDFISGTGTLLYDNENGDEYIYISDENTSAELNMNDYSWKLKTTKDGLTEISKGYSNELPAIEYTSIKKDVLYYLNRALFGENTRNLEDKTVVNNSNITADGNSYGFNLDIEYQQYHVTVDAVIDKTGNIIDLNIYKENKQYIPDNDPKTITFRFTGDVVYDNPDTNWELYKNSN